MMSGWCRSAHSSNPVRCPYSSLALSVAPYSTFGGTVG